MLSLVLLTLLTIPCFAQPFFDLGTAYALCQSDPVCADLYGLGSGGSEASFWLQLQIEGVPASPDDLVTQYDALIDKGAFLTLVQLVRIGGSLPRCPYDMVMRQDPITGVGHCECPMGINCRPACSGTDIWIWATAALALLLMLLFALRLMLFDPLKRN
jgi:hypothetical protein